MNPFQPRRSIDYHEIPPEAPKPRMWKVLGHVEPGVEAQYALASFGGDLDLDREAELRRELAIMFTMLRREGAETPESATFVRYATHSWPEIIARFVACSCGENGMRKFNN